jgi:hypothetical protein
VRCFAAKGTHAAKALRLQPGELAQYRGVRRVGCRFQAQVRGQVVGTYGTALTAAYASDGRARRKGWLHLLNFPANAAERAAAAGKAPAAQQVPGASAAAVPHVATPAPAPPPPPPPASPDGSAPPSPPPPPLAPPAASPAAPESESDPLAAVAAFLCAIRPPLSQLHAVLGALPGSGVSMAHLASIAASNRPLLLAAATADVLGIRAPFERLVFTTALQAARRRDAAGRMQRTKA